MRARRPWPNDFLSFLDATPPFFVVAVAHTCRAKPKANGRCGGLQRRLTLPEMVAASGLSKRTFERISSRISWHGVKAGAIAAFCRGCRFDFLHQTAVRHYLRSTSKRPDTMWSHLTPMQRKRFNLLSMRWLQMRQRQSNALALA